MLKCQLAKVYGKDKTPQSKNGYFITEKLDGNRCIAEHNGKQWTFTSRTRFLRVREDKTESSEVIETYINEVKPEQKQEYKPEIKATTPKKAKTNNKPLRVLKTAFSLLGLAVECIFYLIACLFGISFFLDLFDKK